MLRVLMVSIWLKALCLAWGVSSKEEGGRAYAYPSLAIPNAQGELVPLFSREAYRAEFRYLQRVFQETDLRGPAVVTDGWTSNIPEAEWPFMGFSYFGYACVNLAMQDAGLREEAFQEVRWLIEALQTPRLSGFVAPHFGAPFSTNLMTASTFVHGHFLNLVVRYREASGDARYDGLAHRIARLLSEAFERSDQGILKSYQTMWWLADNFPALSALSRYDRVFQKHLSQAKQRSIASIKRKYLDPDTGLFCTYIDAKRRIPLQGARGISTMYALHFLNDIDGDIAAQQYRLAQRFFLRSAWGFAAAREFPEGSYERPDVDSGPVVVGLGPSASGFAIAAAGSMGDADTAWQLIKSSAFAGGPVFNGGELRYSIMPPVGQAVIFYGKTILLEKGVGPSRTTSQ
jgi:hypothetical protein